ncbi:Hsp20 family protein [Candidatus Poribacteria bacterium]|nr:Hsp20 family protein [Candidatus Poribacteria bacterium]
MVTQFAWDLFKDPFFIGFDKALDTWNHVHTVSGTATYPPYNVIKVDEDNFVVELAVAGFGKSDIEASIADGKLTVKGESKTEDADSKFIHRGISARKFTREWALGEYMEVKAAELKDGMLKIDIIRILPEEKKPKIIKIK